MNGGGGGALHWTPGGCASLRLKRDSSVNSRLLRLTDRGVPLPLPPATPSNINLCTPLIYRGVDCPASLAPCLVCFLEFKENPVIMNMSLLRHEISRYLSAPLNYGWSGGRVTLEIPLNWHPRVCAPVRSKRDKPVTY